MDRTLLTVAFLAVVLSEIIANGLVPEVNLSLVQCAALSLSLGSKVTYPRSSEYLASTNSYFSAQERSLSPRCIVRANTSTDVATAVKTLSILYNVSKSPKCRFAVRSGGHTPAGGWANIDGGVTLDLSALNATTVSKDSSTVFVGPGAGWSDISKKLDSLNLAVAGGRVSDVGVGGLSLGGNELASQTQLLTSANESLGGMSFFSPRRGWACDGVVNFEIVTANGRILNANAKENSDLWTALRGGSNNFGVVTRLDLTTFNQGKLWGGGIFYPISTAAEQIAAFYGLITATPYDEFASITQIFGFSPSTGAGTLNFAVYTKPIENPPTYQPFTKIRPQLFNTFRTSNLTDFTDEQAALSLTGLR